MRVVTAIPHHFLVDEEVSFQGNIQTVQLAYLIRKTFEPRLFICHLLSELIAYCEPTERISHNIDLIEWEAGKSNRY